MNHLSIKEIIDFASGRMDEDAELFANAHLLTCKICAKRASAHLLLRDYIARDGFENVWENLFPEGDAQEGPVSLPDLAAPRTLTEHITAAVPGVAGQLAFLERVNDWFTTANAKFAHAFGMVIDLSTAATQAFQSGMELIPKTLFTEAQPGLGGVAGGEDGPLEFKKIFEIENQEPLELHIIADIAAKEVIVRSPLRRRPWPQLVLITEDGEEKKATFLNPEGTQYLLAVFSGVNSKTLLNICIEFPKSGE